ncbi:MAG TPA: ATP-dependent metallopeptidase FtsH/Yme1/Tma family protein, partial [Novosphingobium sp.]|nr:ATP-dependent metallopeptidase FtsH/Yme1/Tma family protein [Novosphingobium sp.]
MNEDQPNGNPWLKSLLVWGGIFMALLLVVSMFSGRTEGSGSAVPYSDFRSKVAEGSVADVQVGSDRI